jgi:hypothetical protein
MLERAVTWIIIMIVIVFDPLAVIMLLASQMTFAWNRKPEEETAEDPATIVWTEEIKEQPKPESTFVNVEEELEPVFEREEIPDLTDYSEGHIKDPEPEEDLPVVEKKPRWAGFSFPMTSVFGKPKEEAVEEVDEEPVLITRIAVPESNVDLQVTPEPEPTPEPVPEPTPPPRVNLEAAPGRNRGVMHTHLVAQADNAPDLGKASHSDFGNTFPPNPEKGDVYLRTDYLPNRLFKYNGNRWIEVDKRQTDVYAYEEAYIKHLVSELEAGRYDPDTLTDVEQEQIKQYLNKN